MVLPRGNPNYMDLPGLSTLIGGMWIVNLNYWGCNQYITQRALGADLPTARKGMLFAAFLKLLMPVIVVLPGIAAYALDKSGALGDAMRVGRRTEPRPRLPDPAGPAAVGPERRRLRRADRGRGRFAGRQGQLDRHHLHARHLQEDACNPDASEAEDGLGRPRDRGGGAAAGGGRSPR